MLVNLLTSRNYSIMNMKNLKRTLKDKLSNTSSHKQRSAPPLFWRGGRGVRSIVALVLLLSARLFAQQTYTIDQALTEALKNNESIKASRWNERSQQQLKKTSFELPKTNFSLMYGQYNGFPNDNNFTITQNIPFTALGSQRALNNSLSAAAELKRASDENELIYQVKQVYHQLAFSKTFHALLLQQDSIYEGFLKSASARYRTGETNLLEKTTAETQRNDMKNRLHQSEAGIEQLRWQLQVLLHVKELPDISEEELQPLILNVEFDTIAWNANPALALSRQQIEVAEKSKKLEASKLAPDLMLGYFNQTLTGSVDLENGNIATGSKRFSGIQVGLALPIFFNAQQARVKAADYSQNATRSLYQSQRQQLSGQWQQALLEYQRNKTSLQYYDQSANVKADLILKQSSAAMRQGEIGYAEYLLSVRNALAIKEGYWQTVNALNQSIIYLEFLSAKK
jgi:heavy metal efflux system protein